LHGGLVLYHLMMEGVDRRQRALASSAQSRAYGAIYSAAEPFRDAAGRARDGVLTPIALNDQERQEVAYFQQQASRYDIRLPVSQRDLMIATARIVTELGNELRSTDVGILINQPRARQNLGSRVAEIQLFLITVTTVLRITG
jgi:hypothetical protein